MIFSLFYKIASFCYRKSRGLQNYCFDLWYVGHSLRGSRHNATLFLLKGCYPCESAHYKLIKDGLRCLSITDSDVIIDLGCGQGRPFHYLCAKGFKGKCIGIELWEEVALATKKELAKYDNVTIVNANFLEFDYPDDFTIAYYFNSANEAVTKGVIEKLEGYQRPFRFAYLNALYSNVIIGRAGWTIAFEFDTRYRLDKKLHSIIFEYNPT